MEYWKNGILEKWVLEHQNKWKFHLCVSDQYSIIPVFQYSSVRIHEKNLRLHTEILTSNLRKRGR